MEIVFASHNKDKFQEVSSILESRGITAGFADLDLVEIQGDSLEEIAAKKASDAYDAIGKPVLVEDDGLDIQNLGGFPGQYSSYVFKTIGNDGILKLLKGARNRNAKFVSVMGFTDGNNVKLFKGITHGSISTARRGTGWGFDPIFIADGANGMTYAQLGNEKATLSHRRRALDAFASGIFGN